MSAHVGNHHLAPGHSLRSLVLSGFAWSAGTSVIIQISRIVFAVAMARFLTPHQYGLAAMAFAFAALIGIFTDLALGIALVQRDKITDEDCSTVFWLSAGMGLLLTVVGVATSGLMAKFYGEPDVRPLFAVLSISFLLGSLGATHAALLHRSMNFRSINIRVGSSTLIGGGLGVGLAAVGFGAWALIVQQICIALVSTILLWISMPWRPSFVFSLKSFRELGSFGSKIFGVRLVDFGRQNGDTMVIGRLLGSAQLGIYAIAYNVLLAPVARFVLTVTDTLFPALSRLQNEPQRFAMAWLRVTELLAAIFVPALLGLVVVAPDFVQVVLGNRWHAATLLLRLMAAGMLVQAVTAVGDEVLKARGRGGTLLRFYVVETAAVLAGVVIGVHWGIVGVAAAFSAVLVVTRSAYLWLVARMLSVPLRVVARRLSGVLQASLVLVAATLSAQVLLTQWSVTPALRLSIVVAIGVALYIPLCLWRAQELRSEVTRIKREGLRGAATTA
jgi:O-antigen/teichoic acid export membrane protein